MDFIKIKARIFEGIGKYKYVWIVLLIGMLLMMMPDKNERKVKTQSEEPAAVTEENLEDKIETILSHIEGAGRVEVLLTVAQGERILYQTDSSYTQGESNTDSRTQTILVTDSQRNETGLIHQKIPPVYMGAIILAEGADQPRVKLAIVDAISDATGLSTDKISVLKMN